MSPNPRLQLCDLSLGGNCSFCGTLAKETRGLVGVDGRPVRVCDGCIGLCVDILADGRDMMRYTATLARFAGLDIHEFRCSFCDTARRDVDKMIPGPRVFICDACVGAAAALVKHLLPA